MIRSTLQKSLFIFLIALLMLAPAALSAQDVDLSETISVTIEELTLSANYPDSWFADIDTTGGVIHIGSSEDALEATMSGSNDFAQGDVGITLISPGALESIGLDISGSATDVLTRTIAALAPGVDVEVSEFDAFGTPGSIAQLVIEENNVDVLLIGFAFDAGTVIAGIQPSDSDTTGASEETKDIVEAIMTSISLTTEPDQVDSQVQGETISFEVEQPNGTFEFSINMPEGWVSEHDANVGALYMASSDDALDMVTGAIDPDDSFAAGDLAISIALPSIMELLELELDADPLDAVNAFAEMLGGEVQGGVQTAEAAQGVPVRIAPVTGAGLPGGSAVVAGAAFEAGTILVVVSPMNAFDDSIVAILDTIQFGDQAAPVETGEQGEALSFEVEQPNGTFEFSVNVPEGWVSEHDANVGALYLASSDDALELVTGSVEPGDDFAEGDRAISIALPSVLEQLGVALDADEIEAVVAFVQVMDGSTLATVTVEMAEGVATQGVIVSSDGLPSGNAAIVGAAFEAGTILVVVTPAEALDDEVISILETIRFAPVGTVEVPSAEPIRQWASDADGSSQYGSSNSASWGFDQATGEPNTNECADRTSAWAAARSNTREILRVSFDTAVIPTEVNIYQTYNPGAIVQIDVANSDNPDLVLPIENSADPVGNTDCPGVFTLDLSHVEEPIDSVVIYLDQTLTGNWNEIDAVELVGVPAE